MRALCSAFGLSLSHSLVAFEGAQIAIDCICNQNNSKTIFERVNCIISTLEFNDTKQKKKLFDLKEIANVYLLTDFIFLVVVGIYSIELCNKASNENRPNVFDIVMVSMVCWFDGDGVMLCRH